MVAALQFSKQNPHKELKEKIYPLLAMGYRDIDKTPAI